MSKKSMRLAGGIALSLALILSGCGAQGGNTPAGTGGQQPSGGEIKIGLPLPITGSEATFGKDMQNAINLAVSQINAKGGVDGKKIVTVTEDDACDPQQATAAANKLVSEGVVAVVGGYCSGAVIPTLTIYNAKNIPFVITAANSSKIAKENPGNTFEINGTLEYEAQRAVELFKSLGVKNLAIVEQGDAFSADLARLAEADWKATGNPVVAHEVTNKGEQDFSSLVTTLRTKKPDMVFWTAYYADGGLLIKQLRQGGYKGPITVGDGSADPKLIQVAGPAGEGTYVLSPPVASYLPAAKQFVADYKAQYHQSPGDYSALAYDGMNLMAHALKQAGSTDGKAIIKALAETKDFPGIAGKINFTAEKTLKGSNIIVLQIKNGKFTAAQ
ncbi:Leu/Ile/Val-binding protein family signature [Acididesulfobacillus acetoxydans]|uniref:Leu/Ile/Val-binding protein family signature n=1 Tax=Acididesulfobacillus acetoxydans TaxID=1561005 RepID=A0A8S0XWE0_9FIRM|nr:branched-chain amino acid ABC transporter substrate-binding protein [Acididesulfobacillus acetoxydans]CAA7600967.1 Leu/Ile/Val-binding protein family signature [Acididesulfobacillus acetoxydans]CEJ07690.1 Leu/Ile/Val-binding protein homolog 1 [Acididesulfobacillus acetoxydans]